MAFSIKVLSADEIKDDFKRRGNDLSKLDDYVNNLKSLSVGQGFTVRVIEDTVEGTNDTVRAFRRRIKAAANSLDLIVKWKEKGHKNNDKFIIDWLVARIEGTKVVA